MKQQTEDAMQVNEKMLCSSSRYGNMSVVSFLFPFLLS
jgi:hypothetical protein